MNNAKSERLVNIFIYRPCNPTAAEVISVDTAFSNGWTWLEALFVRPVMRLTPGELLAFIFYLICSENVKYILSKRYVLVATQKSRVLTSTLITNLHPWEATFRNNDKF